ncbi:MAG: DUF4129 domain-containing protein [Firmicutes bacterium]|nr:DUF4129 domain-containing protein [Bacillota bacterium]
MGARPESHLQEMALGSSHPLNRIIMPLLAAGLVTSLLTIARQFSMVFWSAVEIPAWLIILSGGIALFSVYTTEIHLKMRTPLSLRGLEFVLVMVFAYILLHFTGHGDNYGLLSLAWFRDLSMLGSMFFPAAAWLFARGYGQTFVYLGDIARDVGDQGAVTFSWEAESLLSEYRVTRERTHAVSYFVRRFLFYGLVCCIASAVAIDTFANRLRLLPYWHLATSLAVLGYLFTGMMLQASVYLYRLQVIWQKVGIRIEQKLPRQWLWSSTGFIVLMLLFAVSVPTVLSPFNLSETVESLGSWLGRGLDFALPQGEVSSQPSHGNDASMAVGDGKSDLLSKIVGLFYFLMSIFMTLAVLGIGLGVIGMVLMGIFQKEWERFGGLARLPVFVYMWLKNMFAVIKKLFRLAVRRGKGLMDKSTMILSKTPKAPAPGGIPARPGRSPSAPALYIRHLFVELVGFLDKHGIGPKANETALEYGLHIGRTFPEAKIEIHKLTDLYLLARYSLCDFSTETKLAAKTLWDIIMAHLKQQMMEADRKDSQFLKGCGTDDDAAR